jgi:hypothetical protein
MENTERIALQRRRDFGEILNTTFNFLRANYKNYFLAIVYISLPVMLIGGIMSGFGFSRIFGIFPQLENGSFGDFAQLGIIGAIAMVGYLCLIAGMIMNSGVCFEFLIQYNRGSENITPGSIWHGFRSSFGRYVLFNLYLFVIIFIVMITCLVPGIVALATDAIGMGLLLYFLGIMIAIAAVFYFLTRYSLALMVISAEDKGVMDAVKRSSDLISGSFWWTLLLIVVLSFITSTLASMLSLPFAIVAGASQWHNLTDPNLAEEGIIAFYRVFYALFLPVNSAFSAFAYTIYWTGIGLKYYAAVEEKEAPHMLEQIDRLDNPTNDENA